MPVHIKYLFLILVGCVILFIANLIAAASIFHEIFINIGSDLIGVTIVFWVFQLFIIKGETPKDTSEVPRSIRGSLAKYSTTSTTGTPERDYQDEEE